SISYSKVLEGHFPARLFAGKVAIIGASAPVLQDVHTTATSGSGVMPGAEIWANAASTVLRDAPLREAPGWLDVALIVLLGITDENLRLGGVERDCTVLFSDLRGFTTFSESQPAARVIEVVNFYLNEMTEAILAAGGTLIAYMGDGIMAIFGAPLEQEDHADRALAASREMIGPRLERFNAWLAEQGFEHSFVMGVGLNSGPVMAGNVGSEQRVEYTAIGDVTNTASRLEALTKNSGTMLLISDSTRQRLRSPVDELAPFGEVEIRGRVEQLAVWTIWPSDVEGGAGAAAGAAAGAGAGDGGPDPRPSATDASKREA